MPEEESATFLLYDPVQNYELTSVMKKIDQQLRRIKIKNNQEVIWVPLEDLILLE